MSTPDKVIMTYAEFLAEAQSTDLFQQVAEEIALEQKDALVVDSAARTDEEWAVLTNQIANQKTAHQTSSCEVDKKPDPSGAGSSDTAKP